MNPITVARRDLPQCLISVALVGVLCFLAIAIYSPLHVHKNGDPKQCSLNSIEHQVADSAVPLLELPQPSSDRAWIANEPSPSIPVTPSLEFSSRGPPATQLAIPVAA